MNKNSWAVNVYTFGYDGEAHYVNGKELQKTFTSSAEAKTYFKKLQLSYLREIDLSDQSIVWNADQSYIEKIDGFVFEATGEHVFPTGDTDGDNFLPDTMSDEDVLEFAEISGINVGEIVEFEGAPLFYVPWNRMTDKPFIDFDEDFPLLIFDKSQKKMLKRANEATMESDDIPRNDVGDILLRGSIQQLGTNAEELQSLVETSKDLDFDTSSELLSVKSRISAKKFMALNDLLRNPIYEVKEMNEEELEELRDRLDEIAHGE